LTEYIAAQFKAEENPRPYFDHGFLSYSECQLAIRAHLKALGESSLDEYSNLRTVLTASGWPRFDGEYLNKIHDLLVGDDLARVAMYDRIKEYQIWLRGEGKDQLPETRQGRTLSELTSVVAICAHGDRFDKGVELKKLVEALGEILITSSSINEEVLYESLEAMRYLFEQFPELYSQVQSYVAHTTNAVVVIHALSAGVGRVNGNSRNDDEITVRENLYGKSSFEDVAHSQPNPRLERAFEVLFPYH
jgi:hypothetical protein